MQFLTREPQTEQEYDLRPYIASDVRSRREVAEQSYVLRRRYANQMDRFVAYRQRVHLWEKIYKFHPEATPMPHLRSRPKMSFKYPPYFTR